MQAGVSEDLNILHSRLQRLVDQLVKVGLSLGNRGH